MNRAEATKLIAKLSDAYPNVTFQKTAPDTWQEILADVPFDAIMAIYPRMIAEHVEFCPPAGAWLKAVKDAIAPKIDTQAAWTAVHDAIRWGGSMDAPRCREHVRKYHPQHAEIIIAAAGSIGWARLGQTPTNEHGTLLAQFRDLLADAAQRSDGEQVRQAIGGTGDEPKMIGRVA